MQSGQKFVIPAIKGMIPKKNHAFPVIRPIAIRMTPKITLKDRQKRLILSKIFIVYFLELL